MQDCLLRHRVKQRRVKQFRVKQLKVKARVDNKNRLLATHAIQAETIGNLNLPAVLDYRINTKKTPASYC